MKWEKKLSGFWTSGLSLAEYCRRTHLNEKSAGRWMNRFKALGDEEKSAEEILEIVPLKGSLLGTEQTVSGIHLVLGDLHLELDSGFDETTLKRVLRILEERR